MPEILATIAVGIGVVGLVWRLLESLRRDLDGKVRHLDGKIDGVRVELSNVKADLGELKGKIDLIAQGLHIEISGRSRT